MSDTIAFEDEPITDEEVASAGPNTTPMASLVWVKLWFQAAIVAAFKSCTESKASNGGGDEEELALVSPELLGRFSPI